MEAAEHMTTKWMPALLMAAMGLPWGVQSACQEQGRFPLTAHMVAQTLGGNGIQTADEQVTLLARVVASKPSPVLDILSVEPLGGRSWGKRRDASLLVKLACHVHGACLPFYSIVSRPDAALERMPGVRGVSPAAGYAALKSQNRIIMRPGTHATLVMDDARMHVQVAVVSLESGIAGHKIRVESPDHKQIYVGEVVSANLLKRSF
jgi:hypothetical protein